MIYFTLQIKYELQQNHLKSHLFIIQALGIGTETRKIMLDGREKQWRRLRKGERQRAGGRQTME